MREQTYPFSDEPQGPPNTLDRLEAWGEWALASAITWARRASLVSLTVWAIRVASGMFP